MENYKRRKTKDLETEEPPKKEKVERNCLYFKNLFWKALKCFLPIIRFIRKYRREYIFGDFLGGLSATFMHLPQGLGFGVLAGLQSVNGLYTTFFPVMIYMLFGTSPYVSFGTNAVMALLTQTVVQAEVEFYTSNNHKITPSLPQDNTVHNLTTIFSLNARNMSYSNLTNNVMQIRNGVAATASLLTGLILFVLGVCRLGFLTRFMSISFIGGFTTAAAIHIASSQIPKLFSINVKHHSGAGKLVKTYIELFSNIKSTVIPDLIIGIVTMTILLLVKIMLNERCKERMKMPLPIDFIVVVIGTLASYFGRFADNLNVNIIGEIPMGFPKPSIPNPDYALHMILDCVVMAVSSFAMTISLAKLTAQRHGISINDNQELIAYGLCNIGSSFFPCFPQATAPPRTMILSDLGAKSTLNAIPTLIIIILTMLWIGTLFESLPVSIVAAMIIVAMKNLLLQFRDLPRLWKINKLDFMIWIITCFVSVFIDIDYGLLAGIGFSIISVIIRDQLASGNIIEYSKTEDMLSKDVVLLNERNCIKIFRFQAPLHFANADNFRRLLYKQVGNPSKMKEARSNQILNKDGNGPIPVSDSKVPFDELKCVIIDFQMICQVDITGLRVLDQIVKDYRTCNINVYFNKCSTKIAETLITAGFSSNFPDNSDDGIFFIADFNSKVTDVNDNASISEQNTKL